MRKPKRCSGLIFCIDSTKQVRTRMLPEVGHPTRSILDALNIAAVIIRICEKGRSVDLELLATAPIGLVVLGSHRLKG